MSGPIRAARSAAVADRARLLLKPEMERRAEVRRLRAESAQGAGGEAPQTPRRQPEQGRPPRRRMTGKRGPPSPRPSPVPRAAAGTPATGPTGCPRTPGSAAACRRPQQTPGTARSQGPTPRTARGRQDRAAIAFREVLAWHKQHDRMPRRTHDGPEDELAQRWRRWRASAKLTPAAWNLKMRIDALAAQTEAAEQDDRLAARAEQTLLTQHEEWCGENDVVDEAQWRRPALQRSRGGRHPYPSLSNLCNNCYINAPLQCLLHCPAARAELLGAEGESEPLVVQDCRLRWARSRDGEGRRGWAMGRGGRGEDGGWRRRERG